MNRQAKLSGSGVWNSYGDVTVRQAAKLEAARHGKQCVTVEVRCDALEQTYCVTVERQVEYVVHGLRGGCDGDD